VHGWTGDRRTIERPRTERIAYDADDAEWWEGDVIAWAIDQIDKTDVTEASLDPILDAVGEHVWLSGSYSDPYQGDQRVTETSVYLRGEWTLEQRAEVFRRAANRSTQPLLTHCRPKGPGSPASASGAARSLGLAEARPSREGKDMAGVITTLCIAVFIYALGHTKGREAGRADNLAQAFASILAKRR
jgi:hypothetical protein